MKKEKRAHAHQKHSALPEIYRQILGKYYQHQRGLSIDNTKRKDQNQKLIGIGRRILRHLHENLKLPHLSEEDISEILGNT